jgi:hypothetical protein
VPTHVSTGPVSPPAGPGKRNTDTYGNLFRLVTFDAGALSNENAQHVASSGKEYLLALKGEHRTMFKLIGELLDPSEVVAETVGVLDNHTTVTRRLVLMTALQNGNPRPVCSGRRSRAPRVGEKPAHLPWSPRVPGARGANGGSARAGIGGCYNGCRPGVQALSWVLSPR